MAIKLLLVEDVENLGRSGDIVNVKPGYARNFLLPNGCGVIADKNALRMQERLQEERRKQAIEDKKEAEALAGRFEGLELTTIVKVDQEGHMYGSVSALDVVHLLKDQAKIEVEKRFVLLRHPVKELGTQTINLRLKEGVETSLKLHIVAEEVPGKAPVRGKAEAQAS